MPDPSRGGAMYRVGRLWRTLRPLKRDQIVYRLLRRLLPPGAPRPGRLASREPVDAAWPGPLTRPSSMLSPTRVRFLNREGELARPEDWNAAAMPKLWLYNAHYFDDLNAEDAPARRDWHLALMRRWVAENPPARGNGWEPYPTSLRIVNWVKWSLREGGLAEDLAESLAMQARALRARLERHLLGNHYLANAKALAFAGLRFSGAEADGWLETARGILGAEIPEQILADGGHFELSPMYHALALEDVLDLIALFRCYRAPVPADMERRVPAMLEWLAAMSHPDGGPAFFNDAACGIAPTLAEVTAYAEALGLAPPAPEPEPLLSGVRAQELRQSGYVRLEAPTEAGPPVVALCDVAEIGPSYLPGHAHADSLSFECSLGRQRVIVNAGVSHYEAGAERDAQRGTDRHSTVVLNGENSSETWSGFRCGARARITARELRTEDPDRALLRATHDGYRRLAGGWLHTRTWVLTPSALEIEDELTPRKTPAGAVDVLVVFLLHPEVKAVRHDEAAFDLVAAGETVARLRADGGLAWSVEPAHYHPAFGRRLETSRIAGRGIAAQRQSHRHVFELHGLS